MRNETKARLQQHTADREVRRAWQCASFVLCVKVVAALELVLGRIRRKNVAGGNTFQRRKLQCAHALLRKVKKMYT